MLKIVIINGPNLNLLGQREPEVYGNKSFEEYLQELRQRFDKVDISYFQSNHEGALIDELHKYGFTADGIVINPGAYAHTSIALRDAIASISTPVVEVHISDISKREVFRHYSYLTDVCIRAHIGEGLEGYANAITDIINRTS